MHRFFTPALDAGDAFVVLPREEGAHLTRVLRLGPGDLVAVFDGRGAEFLGAVERTSGRDVRVRLVERRQPAPELPVAITLVQAVLKGDKMDEVVRDAAMLGVAAVQPIVTARVETTVAALLRQQRVDRWTRVALASVKQAGRAKLPDVRLPLSFESWLDEPRAALTLMLVEPSAGAGAGRFDAVERLPIPPDVELLVGPEGGWTEAEWTAARDRGLQLVSLGPRTLRADRAPVVALSVLAYLWDRLL
jgi:16S rRNA (uracil1498-N3)-methyltransferase